jgi:hypothetical protein
MGIDNLTGTVTPCGMIITLPVIHNLTGIVTPCGMSITLPMIYLIRYLVRYFGIGYEIYSFFG